MTVCQWAAFLSGGAWGVAAILYWRAWRLNRATRAFLFDNDNIKEA